MHKKIILIALIIFTVILAGCAGQGKEGVLNNTYKQISISEAKEIIDEQNGYIILDVRTQAEYDVGHIPNSLLLPNEKIGSSEIDILPDKDQMILIYCRSGNRSKQAAEKLVKLGYTNIYEFGGILDWPYDIVTD